MTFYNIFQNNRKEQTRKLKIIVDRREKNSLVPSELMKLGMEAEFKHLEVGDYIVNNWIVERKTLSDLQSSIINKRIFTQLNNLQFTKSLLILEGSSDLIIHENAIRGFLLALVTEFKVPFIITKDEKDTARFLYLLAKKTEGKEISLRQARIFKTKEEQKQFILEGFPYVGPVKAKALIKRFSSINNIVNASEEELKEILGKQAKDFISLISE